MTTVGFIGSEQLGSAIARLAVEDGHQVVLSNSRDPDTIAQLGPRASAVTSEEAAAAGDILVVAVPVRAFRDSAASPLPGRRSSTPATTATSVTGTFPSSTPRR